MSDAKISALPSSTGVSPASDFIPIVHNGTTEKITPDELISGVGLVTSSALSATTGATLVGFEQTGSTTTRTVDAKLKETVSVKDFGAVGDGVTDDTAAIQAAINLTASGKTIEVFFPDGNYFFCIFPNCRRGKCQLDFWKKRHIFWGWNYSIYTAKSNAWWSYNFCIYSYDSNG